ncbi:MAG: homoserine dehydrogenase [Verrucomicrobia bacterium]|nr:homoserine dehydrogenase [Verrucomicrobiota bacterium]
METIGVGLLGFGTVGRGVFEALAMNGDLIAERTGVRLQIVRAAVRDLAKTRVHPAGVPLDFFTDRAADVIADPRVRIVVEVMGGLDETQAHLEQAIRAGKTVVTANKALLAERGRAIFELAAREGVAVFFEASTAGGIPIIKAVREAFVANHFTSFHGIINGTSNYILTRMTEAGLDFAQALQEAQAQGYAEADPTLDVNGWDAAHKAILLATLAYGIWIDPAQLSVQGIDSVGAEDIAFAKQLGWRIKLLAGIRVQPDGGVSVGVHPTLIPQDHVLASVNGVFNAIALHGDVVGDALFYGRGAGSGPTASAVISDLADAATALFSKSVPRCSGVRPHSLYGRIVPPDDVTSRFYLRLAVEDTPGVLGQIASALGRHGIGISSALQPEQHDPAGRAQLILMLDRARSGQLRAAVREIESLPCVQPPAKLLRVETLKG